MNEPSALVDDLAHKVIGAAIEVHRVLGPGFLEGVYEEALGFELTARGIPHARQVHAETRYKERVVGLHRLDIVVGGVLILELKAIESLLPIHTSQVISYLRTTGLPLGLLMNFNTRELRDGIRRVVMTKRAQNP